jgi:hypothetical protein
VPGSSSRWFALTARAPKSCERVDTLKTAHRRIRHCRAAWVNNLALSLPLLETLAEGRRRADNQGGMSLLAFAVRRTLGALVVLVIVIWLLQFGVYHAIPLSPRVSHPLEPLPDYFLQFRDLVHQWNVAALEVALALALLLGLGGVWRLRKRRTT